MNTCTPVKGRVFEGLARQHNGGHLQGSKARHTASPIVLKVGIWKVKLGLSENSVSHIPMDYHHVPHENCYLWVSPIFRQTRMNIYLLTSKIKVKNSLLDPVTT